MRQKNFHKYLKNSLASLMILSFAIPMQYLFYFSSVKVAEAQSTQEQNGDYTTSGATNSEEGLGGGVVGYLSGLAPAIAELPLCKGKLKSSMKNLFSKSTLATIDRATELELEEDLQRQSEESLNTSNTVLVTDKSTLEVAKETREGVEDIKDTTKSLEENDTCLKSIGRMVIKLLLQKVTLSTVAWIQSGYEGNPTFIQNPGNFFRDIAKEEILKFGAELNISADCSISISGDITEINTSGIGLNGGDDCVSPYAFAFMERQAASFNRKFADNARYSLNELIQNTTPQYTAQKFQADFASGGWDAWTYMTSVPANNPLGFQLLASNELQKRLQGTYKAPAEEVREALTQAAGYLGDNRCIEPEGRTRAQHNAALELGEPELDANGNSTGFFIGQCKKWEYVTPGQMVAESATKLVNYQDNNLLRAEDLNDAVAAVLDAVLARFSTKIQEGFSNFSREGSDGFLVINQDAVGDNYYQTQTERDYYGSTSSAWMRDNPNFDIRFDLSQAFIDTQRTYADKLHSYNLELQDLTRNIYQADYCIPGPAPNWRELAQERLAQQAKEIPNTAGGTVDVVKGVFLLLKAITVYVSPFGLGVSLNVGGTIEGIVTMLGQGLPEEILTRYFYTSHLQIRTGIRTAPTNQIGSRGDVVGIMESVIDAYNSAIKKTYPKNLMPDVTPQVIGEYRKIPGFNQIIEDNTAEIVVMRSTVTKLQNLKAEVDLLDPESDTDFEPNSDIMTRFARLSSSLVDGDDIARVDRLLKQARDEKIYVEEELILGCENDPKTAALLETTERRPYPEEIFVPFPGHTYGYTPETPPTCNSGEVLVGDLCVEEEPPVPTCVPPDVLQGYICVSPGPDDDFEDEPECSPDLDNPCWSVADQEVDQQVDGVVNTTQFGTWVGTCTSGCYAGMTGGTWSGSNGTGTWTGSWSFPTSGTTLQGNGTWTGTWTGSATGTWSAGGPTVMTFAGGSGNGGGTWSISSGYGGGTTTDPTSEVENPSVAADQFIANITGKSFLPHGYYVNNRKIPADRLPEQDILIPLGILDLNASCPILTIGQSANKAAERSYRKEMRSCRRAKNRADGESRAECEAAATQSYQENRKNIALGEEELGKICSFKGKPRDRVLPFEKFMKIF